VKRFAFRLERIRELRERAERERAAALGHAMRAEQESLDALGQARRAFERAGESAAKTAETQVLPAGTLGNFDLSRDAASVRIDAAGQELDAARVRVDAEQELYGVARRDLRVVDRLKEKRFEAWREAGAREDQKETDSVALNRHSTKEDRT
jgi:flagellar FliJ protein